MSALYCFTITILWHVIVFIFIISWEHDAFYKENIKISIKKIRKREKFYENFFKIKKWKDKIPQYIGKNGFSKKRFISFNISYLKEFIAETYRGEFDHLACCAIIPFLFVLSSLQTAVFFSVMVILINLPCIFIQRYNRARLRKIILLKYNLK
jgi:glycosyl-4,4'-diaponeurosporenoate acyltransferase